MKMKLSRPQLIALNRVRIDLEANGVCLAFKFNRIRTGSQKAIAVEQLWGLTGLGSHYYGHDDILKDWGFVQALLCYADQRRSATIHVNEHLGGPLFLWMLRETVEDPQVSLVTARAMLRRARALASELGTPVVDQLADIVR